MSDDHVTWGSFNGEHHYVDHMYYMIHARSFVPSVPMPYLHILVSVGNDTYGVTGIPSMVGEHRVVQRAGLAVSTQIVYPGPGHGET